MCVSARSGKIVWRSDTGIRPIAKGTMSPDTLYVPHTGGIEAFSIKDGAHQPSTTWEDAGRDRGNLMLLKTGYLSCSDRSANYFRPEEK